MEGNKGKEYMKNGLQIKLIDYLSQFGDNVRVIEYNGRSYQTSEAMVAKGIKACHLCGCLMPIEKESCDDCNEKVFVMYGKTVESEPIATSPAPLLRACAMCGKKKDVSAFFDTKARLLKCCDECRFKSRSYHKKVKQGVLVV